MDPLHACFMKNFSSLPMYMHSQLLHELKCLSDSSVIITTHIEQQMALLLSWLCYTDETYECSLLH